MLSSGYGMVEIRNHSSMHATPLDNPYVEVGKFDCKYYRRYKRLLVPSLCTWIVSTREPLSLSNRTEITSCGSVGSLWDLCGFAPL